MWNACMVKNKSLENVVQNILTIELNWIINPVFLQLVGINLKKKWLIHKAWLSIFKFICFQVSLF